MIDHTSLHLLIGGEKISGGGRETQDVVDPATAEVLGALPHASKDDLDLALANAESGFQEWRKTSADKRAAALNKAATLLRERASDIGQLLTREQGKPVREAIGEVVYCAMLLEFYAGEAKRTYGRELVRPAGQAARVIYVPVGPIAGFAAWNFPAINVVRKVGGAIAAGCSVIVKPSEETPAAGIALVQALLDGGVPGNVCQCVFGVPDEVSRHLLASPVIRKVTFTGSTAVGKTVIAQSASTVKKVSMELGGNAPLIIFDDADIDEAVKGAIICKFRNAGQTCVCANRILVQDGLYDAFAEKFAAAAKAMQMGNGFDDGVVIGPLVEAAAVDKVEEHVQDAVAKGAKVAAGGSRSDIGALFYEPTVLTEATRDMAIFREETFGPVAPLFRFKTEEEVIELANDTEFGLASYFYARDLGRVWRVAEALEYGMVAVNEGILSSEVAPFGGVKESGLGREGSKYGLDDYLEIKYLLMGGLNG